MLPLATLLLFGCPTETNVRELVPGWAVSPETLDFGEVVVDYSSTLELEVLNTGEVEIKVSSVALTTGEVFEVPGDEIVLPRDERTTLAVTFSPPNYLDYSDVLVLHSTDQRLDDLEIPITGIGGDGPTPDIQIEPNAVDFGTVQPGDAAIELVTVSNVGDGPLVIASTAQTGGGSFEITGDPGGFTLDSATAATLAITYIPDHAYGDNGLFTITSNDPDEGTVEITLLGNGGGDFEYPVAVIEGPSEVDPPELVTLDGSSSYDPSGGEIIQYAWELTKTPSGSRAELNADVADEAFFQADVAGIYWAQLQVVNDVGVASAPTKRVIEAIPQDLIHIELVWDTNNSDLDLHLLDGEFSDFFLLPGDCCYCNPNPNWGSLTESSDDARLDLDDRYGFGPENINIDAPADGNYYARVHYFKDNGGGKTEAIVRFYIAGELERTFVEELEGNEVWDVAYVRMPDGVVVEESEEIETTELRECRLGVL